MVTPRSLEELAKSVELAEGSSVEQSIQVAIHFHLPFHMPSQSYHLLHLNLDQHFHLQGSVWAGSFSSRLTDKELQQLFTFLVLVSALEKSSQQRVRLLRLDIIIFAFSLLVLNVY